MSASTPRPPSSSGASGRPARPRTGAAEVRRRQVRRRRWTAGVAALLLAAAVVLLVAGRGSGVAPSVEVAGVDLGLPAPEATAELAARARAIIDRPIDLRAGTAAVAVVRPADLGARPLIGRTLQAARDQEPNILLRGARTIAGVGPERHALLVSYPPGNLERWAGNIAEMIDQPAMPAQVRATGERLIVVPAQTGRRLDQDKLVAELSSDLSALPAVMRLPIVEEPPSQSTDAADQAAQQGRQILSHPATVRVGDRSGRLSRVAVARALRFVGDQCVVSPAALAGPLAKAFPRLERPARSAHYVADDDIARLVASRPGVAVDAVAVARGLAYPLRPVRADAVTEQPRVSTAAARALGIHDRVGSYTTGFVEGEPRVTNIARAAEILDGTIIHPGATMSLNAVLGERTAARGFLLAPMIADSLDVNAVGGGVSQLATTLYNAAFLGGLDIPEHTAHGLYIGRYPLGRDATISWGDPDLVIRNDWPTAVLIHAAASADAVTVSLYSRDDGRRVETTTGEPYDQTAPPTRLIQDPDLDPMAKILTQNGSKGFSVDITRKVYKGDELIRNEAYTTTYRPYPKIYSVGIDVPGGEPPPTPPEP